LRNKAKERAEKKVASIQKDENKHSFIAQNNNLLSQTMKSLKVNK